jgi:hypothetical protein
MTSSVSRLDQRILVHQVHPAKLATDITASILSNSLLWRRRPVAGLVVRYAPPVVASALVLWLADLDRLAGSSAGRYVRAHMPPQAAAVRLAGDSLMGLGAWKRRRQWIVAGGLLVVLGWSHGLLAPLRAVTPTSR